MWRESDTIWQQSDRYEYKSLQQGEIRILEVRRHGSTGELICNIRHAVLEDADPYDAISYTWGSPGDHTHRIGVDRKWIDIKKNAYELLQDRARTFEMRRVWIDCICINQLDNHEKSYSALQRPNNIRVSRKARAVQVY